MRSGATAKSGRRVGTARGPAPRVARRLARAPAPRRPRPRRRARAARRHLVPRALASGGGPARLGARPPAPAPRRGAARRRRARRRLWPRHRVRVPRDVGEHVPRPARAPRRAGGAPRVRPARCSASRFPRRRLSRSCARRPRATPRRGSIATPSRPACSCSFRALGLAALAWRRARRLAADLPVDASAPTLRGSRRVRGGAVRIDVVPYGVRAGRSARKPRCAASWATRSAPRPTSGFTRRRPTAPSWPASCPARGALPPARARRSAGWPSCSASPSRRRPRCTAIS